MNVQKNTAKSLLNADRSADPLQDSQIIADLADARQGQAFFDQKFRELDIVELRQASLLPGWTRAHVIAHVAYNARALGRLVAWAQSNIECPMYESADARNREIDLGATLSGPELLQLSADEAGQLDKAWRNLPKDRWEYHVKNAQGVSISVAETVWMRSRELWLHALDLDNGARADDIPDSALHRILQDVLTVWASRDGIAVRARVSDSGVEVQPLGVQRNDLGATNVAGTLPDLVMWAAGRRRHGVVEVGSAGREISAVPEAPRWL
ncbi:MULTISPECIES: maleylpyruvate isomerase family mycothiol-dependent enzyme [Streptomyces]|uniref:Mycothiol-dependent maleylpyruvate isomerase NagL n=2 Tax=Streptomyces TaxID=1883 RepID=A0ABN1C8J0_9ACTN|nr:maleylpyruvate isomerase family mycothiol-dependent enzyme [Streptomyces sp. AgN23]QTI88283.1 maleylpyruvate isomerase family mycothiol-dependent enzyme [Streptomyces sp. AgN23]WTB09202.1 maleylpyruvate isomerase family mycothiol-dependent enzyme [Streptomyces antimycoticus]